MKTFSRGRKTPINDLTDLSFVKPVHIYNRQSKDKILNAKNYHELSDDLIRHRVGAKVGFILPFSTCSNSSDLFTVLAFEFIQENLKKLTLFQRLKWHYELDIKGFFRRIANDNDFGIDYADMLSNSFERDKLAIVKYFRPIKDDYPDNDILNWTNEEMYLQLDALKLAQYIYDEDERPSCVSELTNMLVVNKFDELWNHYKQQYNEYIEDKPEEEPFDNIYFSQFLQDRLERTLIISNEEFLNQYATMINANFATASQEFERCQQFLTLNSKQKLLYKIKRFPSRLAEVFK